MPTPREVFMSGNEGSTVNNGQDIAGQNQDPNATHDGAPAGEWFGADLPVEAVHGGMPMRLGGFSPSPEQDKLPAPGSSEGYPKAPTGNAR